MVHGALLHFGRLHGVGAAGLPCLRLGSGGLRGQVARALLAEGGGLGGGGGGGGLGLEVAGRGGVQGVGWRGVGLGGGKWGGRGIAR